MRDRAPRSRILRWPGPRPRPVARRQEVLPFLARARRLDRAFKATILAATAALILAMVGGTRAGRYAAREGYDQARSSAIRLLGFVEDRAEVDARIHRQRLRGVEQGRGFLERAVREQGPALGAFLRAARMDRDSAVVRWGNFDYILTLSSAVFEPDDAGRSYRLRPDTRSVWLINLTVHNLHALFEIPDTPDARKLGEALGGKVVPESVQTTNSWGCRGPEPDPDAPVRVLVLGDSNMQGLLVADDQTPPARLEAALRRDLGVPASVLNTGTLGYSLEQYYYTLVSYFERFHPQAVVLSVCNNDMGDMANPANWAEGEYWLDATLQFCRAREVDYLVLPVPAEDAMIGRRDESVFPGLLTKIYKRSGLNYVNPIEEFADEHLRLRDEARRAGRTFYNSPLFNRHYGDNHMSPRGCDLWARIAARRLQRIWRGQVPGPPRPGATARGPDRTNPGRPDHGVTPRPGITKPIPRSSPAGGIETSI